MFLNYIILFSFVKTLNMSLFFQEERDGDFLKACEAIRKENKFMSASDIARLAAKTPAPSFYLTIKGYSRIINFIKKGGCCTTVKSKAELYLEIQKRIEAVPNYMKLSSYELARIVDAQTAPRFYFSDSRAIKLYYNLLNGIRRNNFIARNFHFR